MTRIKRLAKEGSWIVAGQIAAVLGALMLVRVLTEYLSPAEYGQLALGLTVAGLINQVVMGGVTNGIFRFYSTAAEKNDLRGYLRASRSLMGWATLVVAGITVLLMAGLVGLGQREWLGLATATLAFSLLSGYNSALSGIQNAARQRQIVALHGAIDAWLKIALAAGVMVWLGTSSTAVVWGYALSALVVTGSQFYFLRRLTNRQGHNNAPADGNWGKQIWAFSWPFSTWGVFTWAQQVSDRWAMEVFASTAEVGEYVVLFQLGYAPISLATGLMVSFIAPILFQRSGDAMDAGRNAAVHGLTWRTTGTALFITVLGFVGTMALHERLFWFLVAAPYRGLSHWLPWVVLAGGLFAAGQLLSLKFMADMQPKKIIVVKIVTALMGVTFNVVGAVYYGLAGVISGLVAFSVVYLAWMAWLTAWMPSSQASPSLKRL
jgi:O-antigen/teichoic acid export membrane protein